MSDPYTGEIRWFPYMRGAPSGWLACDGSLQQVGSYEYLFSVLGTAYGGDGSNTFGLPDLRGRAPVHQGSGTGLSSRTLGQTGGSETVTLQTSQIPSHTHSLTASNATVTSASPSGTMLGSLDGGITMYLDDQTDATALNPNPLMFGSTGSGAAHENCAPSLPLLACICVAGQYPVKAS